MAYLYSSTMAILRIVRLGEVDEVRFALFLLEHEKPLKSEKRIRINKGDWKECLVQECCTGSGNGTERSSQRARKMKAKGSIAECTWMMLQPPLPAGECFA